MYAWVFTDGWHTTAGHAAGGRQGGQGRKRPHGGLVLSLRTTVDIVQHPHRHATVTCVLCHSLCRAFALTGHHGVFVAGCFCGSHRHHRPCQVHLRAQGHGRQLHCKQRQGCILYALPGAYTPYLISSTTQRCGTIHSSTCPSVAFELLLPAHQQAASCGVPQQSDLALLPPTL